MNVIGRFVLMLALMVAIGCAGEQKDSMPPIPEGFRTDGLADQSDGKTDALTRWFTAIKAELVLGQGVSGTTSYDEWFHGYPLTLKAGMTVEINAGGTYWGVVQLYKKKSNGKYGNALKKAWIAKSSGGYSATLSFSSKTDAEYLVLIGSFWSSSLGYKLQVDCKDGCPVKPHCLEYTTTDADGNSYRNFYAINVDSYEAGKKYLAELGSGFIEEAINPGTCGELSTNCPRHWSPVCGQTKTGTKTFGNLCEFKVKVRQEAGKTAESKGHWEKGACEKPHCLEFETVDESGKPYHEFYAYNVASYEAGKQLLTQLGIKYTNEAINPGNCAAQSKVCPLYLYYDPICGSTAGGDQTFDSVCAFKVKVREEAGTDSKSKGHWEKGQCSDAHCLEYETIGPDGKPLQNFYAINVNSYDEGKKLLAQIPGQFINEMINKGTCAEQGTMCTFVWAPVCGAIDTGKKTFGNVCEFKVAVRQLAGNDGESKGHYELGQCEVTGEPLKFETLLQGSYSGYQGKLESVIYDKEKFANLWKEHTSNVIPVPPLPGVDFGEQMLVVVYMGVRNTGGYGITITEISDLGDEIRVNYTTTSPGPNCIVTMAFTAPFHFVTLARSDKKVTFQATNNVTNCQ